MEIPYLHVDPGNAAACINMREAGDAMTHWEAPKVFCETGSALLHYLYTRACTVNMTGLFRCAQSVTSQSRELLMPFMVTSTGFFVHEDEGNNTDRDDNSNTNDEEGF